MSKPNSDGSSLRLTGIKNRLPQLVESVMDIVSPETIFRYCLLRTSVSLMQTSGGELTVLMAERQLGKDGSRCDCEDDGRFDKVVPPGCTDDELVMLNRLTTSIIELMDRPYGGLNYDVANRYHVDGREANGRIYVITIRRFRSADCSAAESIRDHPLCASRGLAMKVD